MAKKNRMGRNLNALLGGATRNRAAETQAKPSVTDQEKPSVVATTTNQSNEAAAPTALSTTKPAISTPTTQSESPVVERVAAKPATANTGAAATVTKSAAATGNGSAANAASAQHSMAEPVSSKPAETTPTAVPATATTAGKAANSNVEPLPADSHPSDRLRMLGVDQITRGTYQPRRHFDQALLQELADSIKAQGLIQPILVRAYGGKYELIAGERRWRASQLAGINDIPAIVRDMDDQSVAAVSLIENIQRADLNPLEEAQALERLCGEFSMTHQQVAEAVGRSRVAVTNLMRLLELHDDVKGMVDEGELDMGHARALLGAPRTEQSGIAKRIVEQGLTVRAVEKLVKDLRDGKKPAASTPARTDPNIEALGQKLGKRLGAPVSIRHQKNGSGKLEISYGSIDELEGILSHIK